MSVCIRVVEWFGEVLFMKMSFMFLLVCVRMDVVYVVRYVLMLWIGSNMFS